MTLIADTERERLAQAHLCSAQGAGPDYTVITAAAAASALPRRVTARRLGNDFPELGESSAFGWAQLSRPDPGLPGPSAAAVARTGDSRPPVETPPGPGQGRLTFRRNQGRRTALSEPTIIPKLGRSIMGNNGLIITHYRPRNNNNVIMNVIMMF